ncbi:MAG: InlB B-repeat-containing protein [Oscillospiraceae bacterium]|nr:InlB B-repeat-containing protein [Oscillospiraceae bacterium]
MKIKRILSIVLASLLLLGIVPLTAQANPDFPHQVIISFVTGTDEYFPPVVRDHFGPYGPLPVLQPRFGYTFLGWCFTTSDPFYASPRGDNHAVILRENHTLYAVWNPVQVPITLVRPDAPPMPRFPRFGQSFADVFVYPHPMLGIDVLGWFTQPNGMGQQIFAEDVIDFVDPMTIYAHTRAAHREITLDPRGGTVSPQTITTIHGEPWGTLPVPQHAHFDFIGWSTMPGAFAPSVNETTIADDYRFTTLHAIWRRDVTFHHNGGTGAATEWGWYGHPQEWPGSQRYGHTFLGWFCADGINIEDHVVSNPPVTEFFARWDVVISEIHFPMFEENVAYAPPLRVAFGTPLPAIAALTFQRYGYDFVRWEIAGVPIYAGMILPRAGMHALEAVFEPRTITVTFDAGEGVVNPTNIQLTYGVSVVELPEPAPRDRFHFIGWRSEPNGQGELIPQQAISRYTEDITLHAWWEGDWGRVQFTDVPSNNAIAQSVRFGDSFPWPNWTHRGHSFVAWYTSEGRRVDLDERVWVFDGVLVIQPRWSAHSFTVSLHDAMGESPESLQVTFGQAFDLPTLTSFGLIFHGWFTEPNGQGERFTPDCIVDLDGDLTLFAHWSGEALEIPDSITLRTNETASLVPANARGELRFSVTDESIATVDADGNLIPHRRGTTWVYVSTDYGQFQAVQAIVRPLIWPWVAGIFGLGALAGLGWLLVSVKNAFFL